jgi:hypothetical protein
MAQEPEPRKEEETSSPARPPEPTPEERPSRYSRSTRIKAWLGIAFVVALTLGYFYVFYSGIVINW